MILYGFVIQQTGQQISKFFPMGECPNQIILQDGMIAKRLLSCPNISYGKGHLPSSVAIKRREDMTKKNIQSGKRGEEYWRSKNPKLKTN